MPEDAILVVGADPHGSLGHYVARTLKDRPYAPLVLTAGVGGEDIPLNVMDYRSIHQAIGQRSWHSVIVTVGVNEPQPITEDPTMTTLMGSLATNVVGVMRILGAWLEHEMGLEWVNHFVAISSNSAQIARSGSMPYCASKAALSMAIRCAARDVAKWYTQRPSYNHPSIYAYEPGFIAGTPMSSKFRTARSGPSHRIPSDEPLDAQRLAEVIVGNLYQSTSMLNGTTIRIDGGEQ